VLHNLVKQLRRHFLDGSLGDYCSGNMVNDAIIQTRNIDLENGWCEVSCDSATATSALSLEDSGTGSSRSVGSSLSPAIGGSVIGSHGGR